jgi:hypothetical protein
MGDLSLWPLGLRRRLRLVLGAGFALGSRLGSLDAQRRLHRLGPAPARWHGVCDRLHRCGCQHRCWRVALRAHHGLPRTSVVDGHRRAAALRRDLARGPPGRRGPRRGEPGRQHGDRCRRHRARREPAGGGPSHRRPARSPGSHPGRGQHCASLPPDGRHARTGRAAPRGRGSGLAKPRRAGAGGCPGARPSRRKRQGRRCRDGPGRWRAACPPWPQGPGCTRPRCQGLRRQGPPHRRHRPRPASRRPRAARPADRRGGRKVRGRARHLCEGHERSGSAAAPRRRTRQRRCRSPWTRAPGQCSART